MGNNISQINVGSTLYDVRDSNSFSRAPFFCKGTGTTAGTWVATINSDITSYYEGLTLLYEINIAGASTTTLNVNGIGAKTVYRYGTTKLTTHYGVNTLLLLMYSTTMGQSAGGWYVLGDYDSTDKVTLNCQYSRFYTGGNQLTKYKLCMLDINNKIQPLSTGDTDAATKTPASIALRPEEIFYYTATATVNANTVTGANTFSIATNITTSAYTFNSSLATYKSVYLCGTLDRSTGLFTLNGAGTSSSTAWYTQVPDNSASVNLSSYFTAGKDYVFVGRTYSSANYMYLFPYHMVYHFDGTNLVPIDKSIPAINELKENTSDNIIILNCGTSTTVI